MTETEIETARKKWAGYVDDNDTYVDGVYDNLLKDWETAEEEDSDLYKLATACGNVDTRLNRIENDEIKKYKNNTDFVNKYEKAYENLMKD